MYDDDGVFALSRLEYPNEDLEVWLLDGRAGGEGEDGSSEGEWLARLVAARCLLRVGVGDGSSGG